MPQWSHSSQGAIGNPGVGTGLLSVFVEISRAPSAVLERQIGDVQRFLRMPQVLKLLLNFAAERTHNFSLLQLNLASLIMHEDGQIPAA